MDFALSKPTEFVTAPASIQKRVNDKNRNLYDAENYESYLVDRSGNAYEPYRLAWRYLGAYIDCDIDNESGGANVDEYDVFRRLTGTLFGSSSRRRAPKLRNLGSDSGDENDGDGDGDGDGDDDDDCSRKVLWAAYYDPHYSGNSIGEYQFYDHIEGTWDTSTCKTGRCAKMDCHASSSHYQLIGVFKEADGFTDWAEQLFKHEGYCIWDGDKDGDDEGSGSGDGDNDNDSSDYEFMSNRQDYIASGCNSMYLSDDDGNTVYRGLTPLPGGNITDSLYTDEDCTQRSSMSFEDYIVKWYTTYYYDEDTGQQIAEKWSQNTDRWNELMMDYHVCQPCRAYNKVPMYEDDQEDRLRRLNEDDGGGDEEQWGYNCYDDAGYRNCNQCYKFETKTDMEAATTEDLERASKQGTILAIRVDGVTYGRGGIDWHDIEEEVRSALWIIGAVSILGIVLFLGLYYKTSVLFYYNRLRSRRFHKALREAFVEDDSTVDEDSLTDKTEDELMRNKRLVEDQRREIEQIRLELQQEKAIRAMERETKPNQSTNEETKQKSSQDQQEQMQSD